MLKLYRVVVFFRLVGENLHTESDLIILCKSHTFHESVRGRVLHANRGYYPFTFIYTIYTAIKSRTYRNGKSLLCIALPPIRMKHVYLELMICALLMKSDIPNKVPVFKTK